MVVKQKLEAQNPLILRANRLMDAFAKSDDERDFYLDRQEGFIIYVDLDKPQEDLEALEQELKENAERYVMIPKLTFYETKKIMEGFVNEKVYDIDTKEKLLDIIQSKEARENFLEFIYDHHSELEKWQLYYMERSRIRIIEWLRNNHFHFVFEEDLDIPKSMIEKLKSNLFEPKAAKDILVARKALSSKAKTYYSNEALNPRPKRGRPPKQAAKQEIEPQMATDIYTTVHPSIRQFLFIPDISSSGATFSSKFETPDLSSKRGSTESDLSVESLNQKLAALRSLSSSWIEKDKNNSAPKSAPLPKVNDSEEEEDDVDLDLSVDEDTPLSSKGPKHKATEEPVKKRDVTVAPKKATVPPKAKLSKKAAAPKIKLMPRNNEMPKGKPKQKIQSKAPKKK